ncbi:MAG: 4Fe-4S binding protein [Muribaculaceae bacterium]|nr:4Fe-4S binding protein [Muribaculaceae bacterium]
MLVAASITVNRYLCSVPVAEMGKEDNRSSENADKILTSMQDDGVVIHTGEIEGTTGGYAGSVPLDIFISDGKITAVKSLPNDETPSFFSRASGILDSWNGKSPEEALEMKVDAVSGATYSSVAIIDNVRSGLSYYQGVQKQNSETVPVKIWCALAVTLIACILPLFVKNRIYHNVQMIANIVVLGFWCGQFLDYYLILHYISHGFSWPVALVGVVMLIAAFIYPLFGRPQHYCTHICPLGSAQQLMSQICGYKIHLSVKTITFLNWFRKILWAVLMLMLWTDTLTEWMDLELFQAFNFYSASWGIIIAAVTFVLLSSVVTRPYCRFVCPTGSLLKFSENID